jgi:hypothetical protein
MPSLCLAQFPDMSQFDYESEEAFCQTFKRARGLPPLVLVTDGTTAPYPRHDSLAWVGTEAHPPAAVTLPPTRAGTWPGSR